MTKKFTILFLLFSTFIFSQNEKIISGKIISQDVALNGIEIVNFNNKKIATTNNLGEFSISAKENDELIVLNDIYQYKSVIVYKSYLNQIITINLTKKPIELDDVKIRAKESVKNIVTYDDLAQIRIAKENSPLRNPAVFDGKIINGMDFVQIGKMIGKLFKNKKNKATPFNIDFKEYANSNFSKDFFTKTLELKPDETALFLDFCEADPKSKEIAQTEDEFTILDFLITKKTEFRKISSENKK